jgi:ABC-type Fe3+-siderophore transport system permease subunit
MWQRIQTVFLVLAILSLVGSILMPIMIGATADGTAYALYPIHLMKKQATDAGELKTHSYLPYAATAVFIGAALAICVMELRRFDNRVLQMKLGMLNSLILAGAMICAVVFVNMVKNEMAFVSLKNDWGLYLLFGAVAFNWLALRFIRRDEKLVRDSDRLR